MLNNHSYESNQISFMADISGSTILIAEDDEDSRAMLRTFLELEGYRVLEAGDGEEAVEVACRAQPDLIIIDLNMPKLDGIAASEQIRQLDRLREVPILTNSSSGKLGMELFLNVEKLGGGYLEYLPKPFNLEYLAVVIATVLRKIKRQHNEIHTTETMSAKYYNSENLQIADEKIR